MNKSVMLGEISARELHGPWSDFMEKLQSEDGRLWFDNFKRLLRKEQAVWEVEESSRFNPAIFISKGWSYAEPRDVRSATLGLVDYRKVKLSTDWLQGKNVVLGEERRKHILADASVVALNCDHFLYLWNNKEKIPEEWKNAQYVTFDGDVLRSPDGYRFVLYLYWVGRRWGWDYGWLGRDFNSSGRAAALAQ